MKKSSPEIVEFEVTLNCPLRCIHCYCRAGESEEQPSLDEVKHVLKELREAGTRFVDLVGGEPLARKDILDILAYAREIGQPVMVNTNGVLVTGEFVRELKKVNPDVLFGVSIDGASPGTCDALRGKGTFEKALKAIKVLKSEGFRVVPLFVVNALNWKEFEDYVKLMISVGVDGIYVDRFVPVGRGSDNVVLLDMNPTTWAKALLFVNGVISRYSNKVRFFVEESVNGDLCSAGLTHASILADLRVVPCGHFRYNADYTMGDLKKEGFDEIWNRYPGLIPPDIRDACTGCPAYSMVKTGVLCSDSVISEFVRVRALEKEAMV